MAIKIGDDGELDVTQLTLEEKREIFENFKQMIYDAESKWEAAYGPFETAEDSSEEEFAAKLENTPDELIWSDVNYFDQGTYQDPIEGLTVGVNGWAKLPGRQEYYEEEGQLNQYLIASKPFDETAPDCVYSFAQCLCPFCERGENDGVTCEICEGNGNWEIQC